MLHRTCLAAFLCAFALFDARADAPTVGGIPPFCQLLSTPPEQCDAPESVPCAGACPRDFSQNPKAWIDYWDRCLETQKKNNPAFSQNKFMCGPAGENAKTLYYVPAQAWLCCSRNPFSD